MSNDKFQHSINKKKYQLFVFSNDHRVTTGVKRPHCIVPSADGRRDSLSLSGRLPLSACGLTSFIPKIKQNLTSVWQTSSPESYVYLCSFLILNLLSGCGRCGVFCFCFCFLSFGFGFCFFIFCDLFLLSAFPLGLLSFLTLY